MSKRRKPAKKVERAFRTAIVAVGNALAAAAQDAEAGRSRSGQQPSPPYPSQGKAARQAPAVVDATVRAELAQRWLAGERMGNLTHDLGERLGRRVRNRALRGLLKEHFGSKAAYDAARAQRQGAQPERAAGDPAVPPPDDSEVPRISGMPFAEGWKSRHAHAGAGPSFTVFTAPDGREYVTAGPMARADLLVVPPEGSKRGSFGTGRLRLYETSTVAMQERRHERLITRANKAHRARKRAKGGR